MHVGRGASSWWRWLSTHAERLSSLESIVLARRVTSHSAREPPLSGWCTRESLLYALLTSESSAWSLSSSQSRNGSGCNAIWLSSSRLGGALSSSRPNLEPFTQHARCSAWQTPWFHRQRCKRPLPSSPGVSEGGR